MIEDAMRSWPPFLRCACRPLQLTMRSLLHTISHLDAVGGADEYFIDHGLGFLSARRHHRMYGVLRCYMPMT